MSSQFDKEVIKAKRAMLEEILSQVNETQRAFFWRIYKGAGYSKIEDFPEKRLKEAYNLCKRTLK